jgi:hypothetical protein
MDKLDIGYQDRIFTQILRNAARYGPDFLTGLVRSRRDFGTSVKWHETKKDLARNGLSP